MIERFFHTWERRLASVDTNRVVRPFEWGDDWVDHGGAAGESSARIVADAARRALADHDAFYTAPQTDAYALEGDRLTFPSAITTPHPENNRVSVRIFRPRRERPPADQPVVIALPQWNADAGGHVGLCQLFARFGLIGARLSLPYHDDRRPPELQRAEYIVSANVGRTLVVNRQAVLDVKRTVDWFHARGHRRIGIIGTSLGSCLSLLAMVHDERITAGAFNHVSPYFADVVWRGLSTAHVRAGLEGHVTLDQLRELWMPISPMPFVARIRPRPALLVYAKYDLTFPPDLSRMIVDEFARQGIDHDVAAMSCGHYTIGRAPFKFADGYVLTRFLTKEV
jgi:dienelactone hydrolase